MKLLKKHSGFICGFLCCLLLTTLAVPAVATYANRNISVVYNDIKVNVDGQVVTLKDAQGRIVDPFNYMGSVYLPARAIAQALGCSVDWNQQTQTVLIKKSTTEASRNAVPLMDICPPYNVSSEYIIHYKSGQLHNNYVSFNDITYGNSLLMTYSADTPMSQAIEAYFDFQGKYSELTGVVGAIDSSKVGATVSFIADGRVIQTVEVKKGEDPVQFKLNLTGISKFTVSLLRGADTFVPEIALAQLMIK